MSGAQDQEPAPKPITYEELPPEHKKKYDEIKALLEADLIGSLKSMQESSRGADHGSDLCLHVSLYAGNCLEHVRTLLIGYRSGGTPGFPQNLRARDGIAVRRRGSSACQRLGDLPALRVACRYSPVGFDRQQYYVSAFTLSCVHLLF